MCFFSVRLKITNVKQSKKHVYKPVQPKQVKNKRKVELLQKQLLNNLVLLINLWLALMKMQYGQKNKLKNKIDRNNNRAISFLDILHWLYFILCFLFFVFDSVRSHSLLSSYFSLSLYHTFNFFSSFAAIKKIKKKT